MKYLVFTLTFSFLLIACGKDDKEPTKTEILTTGSWKLDNGGIDTDRNGTVDISFSSVLPPCALDNSATFNSDYTGINDEGLLKCGTSQTTPFTWSFASNETAINISGTGLLGISGQFKIAELSATRFGLTRDTIISGINMTAIVNLKH